MHIVFHEPFDCVMSPVDDIPWVQSVDQLYNHTLRIQVIAISPQRMKVLLLRMPHCNVHMRRHSFWGLGIRTLPKHHLPP